jgi:uncharacterized protein YecE (DUF72 family)
VEPASLGKTLRGRAHFGTSGWDYPDWVGPFYAPDSSRRDFLAQYARQFGSVEIDSTFYRMPSAADVARWAERVPAGFLFSPKVPQEITHEKLLAGCDDAVARYVDALHAFGGKLGVVVVQMRYFRSAEKMDAERFAERLAPFLRLFPAEMRVALEVRNKALWRAPVLDVLREQRRGLVLIDHPWMDPPARIAARRDVEPGPFTYVRLLGDREGIEKVTTKWGEIVVDQSQRLADWAALVARTLEEGRDVWVAANNHYAGHGPATIRDLEARVRALLGE